MCHKRIKKRSGPSRSALVISPPHGPWRALAETVHKCHQYAPEFKIICALGGGHGLPGGPAEEIKISEACNCNADHCECQRRAAVAGPEPPDLREDWSSHTIADSRALMLRSGAAKTRSPRRCTRQ